MYNQRERERERERGEVYLYTNLRLGLQGHCVAKSFVAIWRFGNTVSTAPQPQGARNGRSEPRGCSKNPLGPASEPQGRSPTSAFWKGGLGHMTAMRPTSFHTHGTSEFSYQFSC